MKITTKYTPLFADVQTLPGKAKILKYQSAVEALLAER